jgi:glycogen phosphorylase
VARHLQPRGGGAPRGGGGPGRGAPHRRLSLLVHDPERAGRLLVGPPSVQIVVAGKAHHQDMEAKDVLRSLFDLRGTPGIADRLAYLQDYDMDLAARLVAGCDVWINVPRPPMEASGTSGMKSALNGGLNLSVLDGWWAEAHDGTNGWAVGGEVLDDAKAQDDADAEALYDLLEREVVPLFHERDVDGVPVGWVRRVKASLRANGPRFVTGRMLDDYLSTAYRLPSA